MAVKCGVLENGRANNGLEDDFTPAAPISADDDVSIAVLSEGLLERMDVELTIDKYNIERTKTVQTSGRIRLSMREEDIERWSLGEYWPLLSA
jgi:hypothetical protein